MKNSVKVFAFILILAAFSSQAQNGPGGIGSRTGTSTLESWFDANDLDGNDVFTDNPANGTAVSSWIDKSGNANNMTQGTANNRPTYTTGTYNSVRFTNTGNVTTIDYLNFGSANHFAPGTAYFVLRSTDAGAAANTLLEDASRSLRWEQFDDADVLGYTRYTVDDYYSTLASNYGANSIVGFLKSNGSNNVESRLNNGSNTFSIGSNGNGIPATRLGAIVAADAANYDMMEVIVFSTVITTSQVRILENYLSSKYGNIAIANDGYSMDLSGYYNDVAGIGRLSGLNLHTDSQSSIIRFNSPTALSNNEFLYMGHNGGAFISDNNDVPTGVAAKLRRIWAVNEVVGEVGFVTLQVDLSAAALQPVTASDLVVLVDTDNNGVFNEVSTTIVSGATSLGSGIYQFAAVDLDDGNRFTIGTINATQTPLPVKLLSFNARENNNGVKLLWETATETNNDHFTLYRSSDGVTYTKFADIPGAGNSSKKLSYRYDDQDALTSRTYYKLEQVDYDGTATMLQVTSIDVNTEKTPLALFPNPVKRGQWLTVRATDVDENEIVRLVDSNGKTTPLALTHTNNEIKIQIPETLSPGIYFLHLNQRLEHVKVIIE